MLEKEKELHEFIKPILNPVTNKTAGDQSPDEMIKFAFDLILIEALNKKQIQDFFEQKRSESGHSKKDFASGLFESFERLNNNLKKTDYSHLVLTDLMGKKVEFLGEGEFSTEDMKSFQKMGKVSFPDKITLNLKKYTNGLFDGKLTIELMAKLWKDLKIYIQTITNPFNEVLKNGISKQSPEEFPLDGKNYNPSESTHKNGTNLFCNTMPLHIPKEHFKVFTETKNKIGQPFLTEVQLNLFIERAFCRNKELPIQKFNHAPKGEKFQIQKVFYDFYCMGVDYFPSSRCRDNFIRLLTDNFIGWDFKNVKSNFAKQTR